MMDDSLKDEFGLIGFFFQNGLDSRSTLLIQSILKTQVDKGSSLSFSEIYNAFTKENHGEKTSKAWVHRLLKSLIDMKIVDVESGNATRKKYVCDINTLSSGLAHMKEQALNEVTNEITDLEGKKHHLQDVDTSKLAERLHEVLTGEKRLPTSRFLKGLDEFQRVTNETIYNPAVPGDVIRNSVGNVKPFIEGYDDRTRRMFFMAAKGVEVRYLAPPEALREEGIFGPNINIDFMEQALKVLKGKGDEGEPGLHARINPAAAKSHQFACLNNEVMALWISENPPTAAWITRDFNADLIDDIINTFEEQWEKAQPVNETLKEIVERSKKRPEKGA